MRLARYSGSRPWQPAAGVNPDATIEWRGIVKTIIIGALCAILGGSTAAFAQTNHIFGDDGPVVKLDAMCHRPVVPPPGQTIEADVNVLGQQVHCLIRRPDPFARCVKRLGAAPAVQAGDVHPNGFADWKGVDRLQAYVASVADCANAKLTE